MKFWQRKMALATALVISMASLTGCGSSSSSDGGTVSNTNTGASNNTTVVSQHLISEDTVGDISIMIWSGDSVYYENIGAMNWQPQDITSQNVAAVYAMAKEFNKTYPNVKINLWAKTGDPNGEDISWEQELENFRAEHGKYPDIYTSTNLPGDTSKGLVADLSVYSDDPLYQSFNSSIMDMLNYNGVQAGLPQYLLAQGVYVNKELAEQNNIDVPEPDWDVDDYTTFVKSADNKTFYGGMDAPLSFINTGTKDINYNLKNGNPIDLTTDAVSKMLDYIPEWSKTAVWAQHDVGQVSDEFMNEFGWWGYNFFIKNKLLTYDGDPWMIGSAGMPIGEVDAVESNDWDIYPRPSTDYVGNTVGIVIDPMAIHNYAMDDGNPAWSDAEKEQLNVAYTFASYWCGSTEAMQVRADQQYSDNGTIKTSLNDSLPLVTGQAFEDQMNIWYSIETHQRYQDANLMPGFQEVMKIWEKGDIWDISDKTDIYYTVQDGQQVECLSEWTTSTHAWYSEFLKTDAGWLDNTKSKLADWTVTINKKFDQARADLDTALTNYYGR